MIYIAYTLKISLTIAYLFFLSLTTIKIYSLFTKTLLPVGIFYLLSCFYLGIFLYLLARKSPSLFHFHKEHYLLMSTLLRLEKTNPFYSSAYNKLKPFSTIFLKELIYDTLKLFLFASLFFAPDKIVKNMPSSSSRNIADTFNQNSDSSPSPTNREKILLHEIKKLQKIKNILKNHSSKNDLLINEIMQLKTFEENDKIRLVKNIIDKNIEQVSKELLFYTRKIKKEGQSNPKISSLLEALEKELKRAGRKATSKKTKNFKMSVEYLNKWLGYEDILKKYFK